MTHFLPGTCLILVMRCIPKKIRTLGSRTEGVCIETFLTAHCINLVTQMIASVGTGEYGRLKSCLETEPSCCGMTGQISGTRCFLATGQSVVGPCSTVGGWRLWLPHPYRVHRYRRSVLQRSPDGRPEGCVLPLDHAAIHLDVLLSRLQSKAYLAFCSTAVAAMQLLGEGNRVTQSVFWWR